MKSNLKNWELLKMLEEAFYVFLKENASDNLCTARMESILRDFLQTFG